MAEEERKIGEIFAKARYSKYCTNPEFVEHRMEVRLEVTARESVQLDALPQSSELVEKELRKRMMDSLIPEEVRLTLIPAMNALALGEMSAMKTGDTETMRRCASAYQELRNLYEQLA